MEYAIAEIFLAALEQVWGIKLPKGYREFLLKQNGKWESSKRRFLFKNAENGSLVDSFFGIKRDENNNLLMNIELYRERIPLNMFPIADDCGGNLILMSVKGQDRGKIYFWDHEMEADPAQGEEPSYDNLTLISDSFDEFLNSLQDLPKES